ncbi:MAG TPA: C40 family peptidase [Caldimonas sp.]|nr:C40 family peptidase [Caldimonas sp.]
MSGRRAAFALAAWLAAGSAVASPDTEPVGAPAPDPLMQLVTEKGVAAPPGPALARAPLVEQVRMQAAGVRERASDAVVTALAFIGVRYQRGGDGESGFDCSGFTRYVFAQTLGLALPRRADEQAHAAGLVQVRREDLKPGDLVFFNTLKRTFSHVGIYVGDNRFVHAPKPGGEVRTEDMGGNYWRVRYSGARRVDALAVAAPAPADTPTAVH